MAEVEMNVTLQLSKEVVLESLMRDYGQQILQLVYLCIRDHTLAEDITQEVFLKAYKGLDHFRGESDVKTWLYRIAMNESKKYLRSWSFRNIFSTWLKEKDQKLEAVETVGVEQLVMGKLKQRTILRHVLNLPHQYRQIIVLYYYEELSGKQMAEILQISEEAVRQKLHRARRQLKQLLEQEGEAWI
ncbi:sigma-70 family RNA polymerase sigma factor [Brevibacillus ginsengisoli]|uniref:sigma-70 family RNA polymerase sigma factor n=1 Tax=Brevibacillus ginsengisoli TaxID=363854 RepID=UPI003CFA262C